MHTTESYFSVYKYCHQKEYDCELIKFFNIISVKDMLKLFGYFIFCFIYQKYVDEIEYQPILNIVYNARKSTMFEVRSLLSCIYTIFTNKNSIPYTNIFSLDDMSYIELISDKFTKTTDDILISDTSSTAAKKNMKYFTKLIYGYKDNNDYTNLGLISISKNPIEHNRIINISFDDFDGNSLVTIKSFYEDFHELLEDFTNNAATKHYKNNSPCLKRDYDEDNIEVSNVKELCTKIYNTSIFDKNESKKIAPIIFVLKEFTDFLGEKCYISKPTYSCFLNLIDSIYVPARIELKPANIQNIGIQVLIEAIYSLYKNNPLLFSNIIDKEPFIYKGSRKSGDLICFRNINSAISFVKNNIGKLKGSLYTRACNAFFDNVFELKESEIKSTMISQNLLMTNPHRTDYRIKQKAYLAIDIDKTATFLSNVNK